MEKIRRYELNEFVEINQEQKQISTKIDKSVSDSFDDKIIELKKQGYKVNKSKIINRLLKDFVDKTVIEERKVNNG
jgi:hypothetical protein